MHKLYEVAYQVRAFFHSWGLKLVTCTMSTVSQLVLNTAVTDSLFKTTTMATDNKTPTRLRIGPEWYNYVYSRLDERTWLCERGSDWAYGNKKLVLKHDGGLWTAYDCDVPSNLNDLTANGAPLGIPVFQTFQNPILQGWHVWRTNWNRSAWAPDWRATGLRCITTHLG